MIPYIHVEHSKLFPDSITVAAWTGAPWRFLTIPSWVLRRSRKGILHWISWRVRHHFRQCHGKLFLFGEITGYRMVESDHSLLFDCDGRFVSRINGEFIAGSGRVVLRRRSILGLIGTTSSPARVRSAEG